MAQALVVASLYFVLVWYFQVISFYVFQLRIADCLIPTSAVLGTPAVLGVTIGCLLANMFAPWGVTGFVIIDMVLGSLANLLASYAAYKVASVKVGGISHAARTQLGCIAATVIITIIVGSYIPLLVEWAFEMPSPIWIGWLGVGTGSLITINGLGYFVTVLLRRSLQPQAAS